MLKGIDVSTHNGVIDWNKVKTQIDYAIIRCGFGSDQASQDDKQFKRNVEECIRLGIPFGIYLYSYANTLEKANSEANHVLRLVNPYKEKVSMGIWYDIEDKIQANLEKNLLANIISIFCNKIEENGYYVGIYANKNWLENRIDNSLKERYAIWIAQYNSKCTYSGKYYMWQYTSDGNVNGINGRVDMNECYKDNFVADGQATTPSNTNEVQSTDNKKEVIRKLQHAYNVSYKTNLVEDGIKGPKTETAMRNHYLKNFTQNELVKWVQDRLVNHKHYNLGNSGIDGKYGKDTENAVRLFQKDNGLEIDGKAGYNTISILI